MKKGPVVLGCLAISVLPLHLLGLKLLVTIVPDYLPKPRELVVAAGVTAAAGGVGLMMPATRRAAAWGLVAWLIAVYPANLWMAQHPERYRPVPAWMLYARLPLQLPMLWWAWRYTRKEHAVRGR